MLGLVILYSVSVKIHGCQGTHVTCSNEAPDIVRDLKQFQKLRFNICVLFQVKEYCPLVFRNLRKRFGIDDASYLKSLTKAPLPMEPPTGPSGGAKFYTSQDHIYTIKTLTSEQVEQMHLILKHYHPYIVERHGKTLLPQILVRHHSDSLTYFSQFSSKKF